MEISVIAFHDALLFPVQQCTRVVR